MFDKMYVYAFKLNLIEYYYSLFIFTGIFYKKNTGLNISLKYIYHYNYTKPYSQAI